MGRAKEVGRTLLEGAYHDGFETSHRSFATAWELRHREQVRPGPSFSLLEPRPPEWRALWRRIPLRGWPRGMAPLAGNRWSLYRPGLGFLLQNLPRLTHSRRGYA